MSFFWRPLNLYFNYTCVNHLGWIRLCCSCLFKLRGARDSLQEWEASNTSRDIVSKSLRRMTLTGSLSNCCLVTESRPTLRPHRLRCARAPLSSTTSLEFAWIHVHCTESLRSHSYKRDWPSPEITGGTGRERRESHVIRGVILLEVILGYSLGEQPAQPDWNTAWH